MTHEVLEERELTRSELDGDASPLDVPGEAIETQVRESQFCWLLSHLPAARQRLHPGEQFWKREGLGQIVVASGLQALDSIVHRVARAEEEDRGFHASSPESADQAQAIEARQHDVDDGGGVGLPLGKVQTVYSVVSDVDGKPLLSQTSRHEVRDTPIILHEEHAHEVIVVRVGGRRQGDRVRRYIDSSSTVMEGRHPFPLAVLRTCQRMTTPTQCWDPTDYAANARFVADLGQPVLDLLQPQPGERILDVGCGDGALTARLAERGAIVMGIDASAELLTAARARGLDARLMDARALTFTEEFDAVFSNAALHWIPVLTPVLQGVHRALRPHGRFVGECGGHGCVAAVLTSLRAVAARRGVEIAWPWRFPTVDEFEAVLVETGFEVVDVRLVPRPTPLPSGMAAWLHTFAAWAFERLPEAERTAAFAETVELLRPSLCDSQGRWTADYMRLRFVARRAETGS